MEILVKDSIPLDYLIHVTFGSKKEYEYFKDELNTIKINCSFLKLF